MSRILCLWFPRWPLERLLAAQPELRQHNVLLYEQTPQGTLRIVAATAGSARPGMSLAEGLAIAEGKDSEHQSPIHLESHDPWADRQALVDLAEACRCYSPTVGIEDAPRPDCLFLDLTGLAHLHRSEAALIEQMIGKVSSRGYMPSAAVAETIGAAWGIAHCGASENPQSAIRNPQSLSSLPVVALRLPEETLILLSRLGLRRVGQVESLPREALISRFGPQLLLRLDQMFGRAAETLLTPRVAPQFAAELSFEAPVEDRETIEAACQALIKQLVPCMAARQEGAVQLECRFDGEGATPVRLMISLYRPSASAQHLWELLKLRLESLRLSQPVSTVHLEVLASAPLVWQQQELFATSRRENLTPQVNVLIDRLSNRLGRQAVLRPVLLRDAQPEHACQYLPVAGEMARAAKPHAAKRGRAKQTLPMRSRALAQDERPLCLKNPPRAIKVGLTSEQFPQSVRLAGREHELSRVWGPERIETGWWRSGLVRRDYYRVETITGSRYWIFHDLRRDLWCLHGVF